MKQPRLEIILERQDSGAESGPSENKRSERIDDMQFFPSAHAQAVQDANTAMVELQQAPLDINFGSLEEIEFKSR